jgi:hypothetical protein
MRVAASSGSARTTATTSERFARSRATVQTRVAHRIAVQSIAASRAVYGSMGMGVLLVVEKKSPRSAL